MESAPAGSLLEYLLQVPDPRGAQGRRHSLKAMLAAVVCAVLAGARGYRPIAQWLHAQEVSVWHALGFTRRPPKFGAFRKLLMWLSWQSFEVALREWSGSSFLLGLPHDDGQDFTLGSFWQGRPDCDDAGQVRPASNR